MPAERTKLQKIDYFFSDCRKLESELALDCRRHKTLQDKKELLEKLNKELNGKNAYQTINGFLLFCCLVAIPIGVLFGSRIISFFGIAWVASAYFSFSAEWEKRQKQGIQAQIDFLNSTLEIENQIKSMKSDQGQVRMGPIGLN